MTPSPMRLRVSNVLGVAAADVPLRGITLVAGQNGAGKSSLLNAAAAAALRLWTLRGTRKKADAAAIVRTGAQAGSAALEWGTGAVAVNWPSLEIEATGDADVRAMGSPFAIGALRWMEASADKRMADLAERLQLAPSVDEIAEFLAAKRGGAAAGERDLATAIHDKVSINGWDATHKAAQEHGSKLKGRWEEASGQKWGSERARDWVPAGLLRNVEYTLEGAEAELAEAQKALDELMKAGAVTDAEIAAAEKQAANAVALRATAEGLNAVSNELNAALEKLLKQRAELSPPEPGKGALAAYPCPHCAKGVSIVPSAGKDGKPQLVKADAVVPRQLTAEEQLALEGLEKAIAETQARMREHGAFVSHANTEAMIAARAAEKLAALRAAPRADAEAVGSAQAEVARLEARRDAVKQMLRARGIYAQWIDQQPIIEALSPGGVRSLVMERRIGAFNATLAALSEVARWSPVAVTAEGEATYGGRAYLLCSESERWRVDLTLQLAFAMQEKAQLVLVDRLDVLTPKARPGAMLLLAHAGIPALVGMTAPDPEKLPDLAGAKLGRCAWIEGGTLKLL